MKRIIFVIILIFAVCHVASQNRSNRLQMTKTGITYDIYRSPATYSLSNVDNVKDKKGFYLLDGSPAQNTHDDRIVCPTKEIHRIVKETLAPAELFALRNEQIEMLFVLSNRGTVYEVDFIMDPSEPLLSVPLEKFAEMETELKKLTFQVGPVTKSLQYNYAGFILDISEIPFDLPPLKPDPSVIRHE